MVLQTTSNSKSVLEPVSNCPLDNRKGGPRPAFFMSGRSGHMPFSACMAAVSSPKIWVSQIFPSALKSQLS